VFRATAISKGIVMRLNDLRRTIDGIDAELVRLLNERVWSAAKIGDEKRKGGSAVHDPVREDEVLARVKELNKGPLSDDAIARIYREIISVCLDVQKKGRDRSAETG